MEVLEVRRNEVEEESEEEVEEVEEENIITTRGTYRKFKKIHVRIDMLLNAVEICLIDRLMDSGLYGGTRSTVARRLIDDELIRIFGRKK